MKSEDWHRKVEFE